MTEKIYTFKLTVNFHHPNTSQELLTFYSRDVLWVEYVLQVKPLLTPGNTHNEMPNSSKALLPEHRTHSFAVNNGSKA